MQFNSGEDAFMRRLIGRAAMLKRSWLFFFAAISASAIGQDIPASGVTHPIVIAGGIRIDVRTGESVDDSAILIRGDQIETVGKVGDFTIPPDAVVIDARGKWVMPGLVDMHVHLEGGDKRWPTELFVANGVTTIREPGGPITEQRLADEEFESGKRVGPRFLYCGAILDGMPPLGTGGFIIADTPERARSAVNFLADQGAACIKVYNSITEPVLAQIVKTASERRLPVIGHVPRALTVTRAVEIGMQGLEHVRVTGREMLPLDEANKIDFLPMARRETLLWDRFDLKSAAMRKLIAFLAERKIVLDPTLAIDEDVLTLARADQVQLENNKYLPRSVVEEWRTWVFPESFIVPAELKEMARAAFEKRKRFVGMCAAAGVRIVAGTDSVGVGTMLPGFALHRELELLVDSGLTPLQAVQAATVNSADALGLSGRLGVLKQGAFADVVILDGDPLMDIKNAARIHQVVAAGRAYQPAELFAGALKRAQE